MRRSNESLAGFIRFPGQVAQIVQYKTFCTFCLLNNSGHSVSYLAPCPLWSSSDLATKAASSRPYFGCPRRVRAWFIGSRAQLQGRHPRECQPWTEQHHTSLGEDVWNYRPRSSTTVGGLAFPGPW